MSANSKGPPLPVVRVGELSPEESGPTWLVEGLWTRSAVGFIGGAPKLGKTWLGLDLLLSVATGTSCLGRYRVEERGETLAYLAEDQPSEVRKRLDALCRDRGLDVRDVAVNIITAPSLRLDLDSDRQRLADAVHRISPKLLLLDPLVRLHRRNENDAAEVSELLAYLRELQRVSGVAIAIVHHMRKDGTGDGQALRGSGDLHAWTDSALYLTRVRGQLTLRAEHRSAPSPAPIGLELGRGEGDGALHLEVKEDENPAAGNPAPPQSSLAQRLLQVLARTAAPMTRAELRDQLRVNNERLGRALEQLEAEARIRRGTEGWELVQSPHR
jgi:hypothetical protein